jgi:hypothetical protein
MKNKSNKVGITDSIIIKKKKRGSDEYETVYDSTGESKK